MLHNAQIVGFAEGTPVLMSDGKWKPIEQVKQGDWVMSFDPKIENSELEPRKVTNTFATLYRDCIEVHANGKVTVVAKDQLFFTPGANWEPGFDTRQVMSFDGSRQDIQVRRVRGGKFKVYDITVDETHALIANDLRVHNGGGSKKKRKVVQAPQPVVTAGKPGKPVSVTTTFNGNTTTVVVNPSPGSSGQVSVSANGSIGVRQNSVPGLPVSDNTPYQTIVVLPYPGSSFVSDRISNAEILRDNVCDNMLNKGTNYRVTKADESAWEAELANMINELEGVKNVNVNNGPNRIKITVDPSLINDAIRNANDLKREIKAGRKLTRGIIQQNCDKIAGILNRIQGQVSSSGGIVITPSPGHTTRPIVVSPGPSTYHSTRIYEDDANYAYVARFQNTCYYVFASPNTTPSSTIKYYKHWDSVSNKYYYDRVSAGATCTTLGGNTQA